jgi:hypothetical protein
MEDRYFNDKSNKPADITLAEVLKQAYPCYTKINNLVKNYSKDWNFSKTSGWMLKYFDKKKSLFYLIPLKNALKISLSIREKEKELILKEQLLDKKILSKIEDAKKFIEGYAIQIDIIFEKDYEIFESLIKKLIILRGYNN